MNAYFIILSGICGSMQQGKINEGRPVCPIQSIAYQYVSTELAFQSSQHEAVGSHKFFPPLVLIVG